MTAAASGAARNTDREFQMLIRTRFGSASRPKLAGASMTGSCTALPELEHAKVLVQKGHHLAGGGLLVRICHVSSVVQTGGMRL